MLQKNSFIHILSILRHRLMRRANEPIEYQDHHEGLAQATEPSVTELDLCDESYVAGPFLPTRRPIFIDIELSVDISWEQSRRYRYSKLYYADGPDGEFSEQKVVCFRIERNLIRHRIRIKMPNDANNMQSIFLRFDPFPFNYGRACVYACTISEEMDPHNELTRRAILSAQKRDTRAAVKCSEDRQLEVVSHYPESMSLELQPGCNLQCGHCATHGTPQAHKHNNRLGAIDAAKLEALASEVFPHMTLLHLVGRGEPLMVSDKLWSQLVNEVIRNRLLLTIVTNGHFVERRITPDVMPSIDTLTVSIDGFSPDVFASNRGGASFERVIQGVRYYHELRKSISLPRRPKLCISWTLKRNNIEELPDFIRYIAQFEPDRFYMRHLLVCHDKDESESLLNYPDLSNRYLSEAYDLFVKMGIETDCPPLMSSTSAGKIKPAASVAEDDLEVQQSILQRGESCHYIHRTASLNASGRMTTCGIYHAKLVGTFNEESSFSSLWNGEVMRCVRRDINTPNEWDQCAKCWFRQSRYRSQRAERAKVSSFSLKNEAKFTKGAWDYRSPKRKSTSDIALVLDEQITHSL